MNRVAAVTVPSLILLISSGACLWRATTSAPVTVSATPRPETHVGFATYYGSWFHGRPTASGIPFDMHEMVAAHPTLPFGSLLRITNLHNGRTVDVRVVDRGPALGPRSTGVIVDLSRAAADALDFIRRGRARIRLEVLERGPDEP